LQSRVATSQSSKAAGQAEGLKHYSPGDARSPRLRHPGTQALPGRASLPWLDRRHPQSLSHWPSRPSSAVNPRPDKVLRPPNRPAGKRSATNPLPPPRRVNFGSRLTVRGFVVSIRNPWSPGRPHSAISLLLHRSPSGRNRIVPPSPPLRPFDPGAPGLRAGRSLRAGLRALCGELPCRLPSRLFPRFPPFSAVSASSALKAVPFAVAFPLSLSFSACSAISLARPSAPPGPAALKAVQFPCQRRGKKVTNIKVCTWHG
jgi:hypothetical protein